MAAILYDFPGVPGDGDPRQPHPQNRPWVEVRYEGIYQDLKERGLPVPTAPAETIERATLIDHLQALLGELVRAEIESDPHGAYRDAETHEEHAAAFSNHLLDDKGRELRASRLSDVLARFPHAPNILTADDIAAALGNG